MTTTARTIVNYQQQGAKITKITNKQTKKNPPMTFESIKEQGKKFRKLTGRNVCDAFTKYARRQATCGCDLTMNQRHGSTRFY